MTTTPTPPAQTALMPLDPAVSPQAALRVLPIRANLLPDEITAGRSARRTRTILIFAVVLTLAVLGGWYGFAASQRSQAGDQLNQVTAQVDRTRAETKKDQYTKVTNTIGETETINEQLKIAMATDLPWNTLVDKLRSTGVKNVTVTSINGALDKTAKNGTTTAAGAAPKSIGKLTINGEAKDKKTIALYLEAAAKVKGVTGVYLTTATENLGEHKWMFAANAEITTDRLCGRFTTTCKDGGN